MEVWYIMFRGALIGNIVATVAAVARMANAIQSDLSVIVGTLM